MSAWKKILMDYPTQEKAQYEMQSGWPLYVHFGGLFQKVFWALKYSISGYKFIARIFLGQESSLPPKTISNPSNMTLGISGLQEFGVPIGLLAHDMGFMLGNINFVDDKDGSNIKFLVGGDTSGSQLKLQYYCVDCNMMRYHNNKATNIVKSYLRNDPYYPRPWMPYWHEFKKGYLEAAKGRNLDLAKEVIGWIEDGYPPKKNSYMKNVKPTKRAKTVRWRTPLEDVFLIENNGF